MKTLIKLLFVIPLLWLGGCYTQLAYRDAYDYQSDNQNYNNDTTTQTSDNGNSEYSAPVCTVIEESPVVDLSNVGVSYNRNYLENIQTKTRVEQNSPARAGNNSNTGSSQDSRNRVSTPPKNQSATPDNGRSQNTNNKGTTTPPVRTRDSGQPSSPSREKPRN
jgi:hypothetical protein